MLDTSVPAPTSRVPSFAKTATATLHGDHPKWALSPTPARPLWSREACNVLNWTKCGTWLQSIQPRPTIPSTCKRVGARPVHIGKVPQNTANKTLLPTQARRAPHPTSESHGGDKRATCFVRPSLNMAAINHNRVQQASQHARMFGGTSCALL